jgi:hypothetical protein
MSDDPRLQQILDDLLDSRATPEELLPAVRDHWLQLQRVGADIVPFGRDPAGGAESSRSVQGNELSVMAKAQAV